jgi:hypothetical protein
MHKRTLLTALATATMLIGAPLMSHPGFAQSTTKHTTDSNAPTQGDPGSQASKQRTDGDSPTQVGPGSMAYKQHTDGNSPTEVGPGSGAYKQ